MSHISPRTVGMTRVQAEHSYISRRIVLPVQRHIDTATAGAVVLLAATLVALVWANSPWSEDYHHLIETHLALDLVFVTLDLSIEEWINDGLMALFFFVVGLEIKREVLVGELSSPRKAALPAIAALGGMVVPALVYLAINGGGEGARGWGIPMATDIAFALGVLALLGRRASLELRVFLLGFAVVDDLGAIAVIAFAYTESISFIALAIAAAFVGVIISAKRLGIDSFVITSILALAVWVAVLNSGIHATVAGVVIAAIIPASPRYSKEDFAEELEVLMVEYKAELSRDDHEGAEAILGEIEELTTATEAPVERMARLVNPWSSYLVLPLFALANAGIEFSSDGLGEALSSSVTFGIVVSLLIGKVVGITLFPWVASRIGLIELPSSISWMHVAGVGLIGGIGFTVAIFVSGLAFEDPTLTANAKLGILVASLIAGIGGYVLLRFLTQETHPSDENE